MTDTRRWLLRCLLIDTSYLLPGRMVHLDMDSVKSIDLASMEVHIEACTGVVKSKVGWETGDQSSVISYR